jgi:hypothetical protein
MKTSSFALLALLVPFAGCATAPRPVATTKPAPEKANPPLVVSRGPHPLIISALYGSGTRYVDVTYGVNNLLRQDDTEFFARPEWLLADPTPGWNKSLLITYELDGRRALFVTGEGGKVSVRLLVENATPRDATQHRESPDGPRPEGRKP